MRPPRRGGRVRAVQLQVSHLFFRRNPRLIDNLPDLLYNRSKHTEGRTAYGFYPLQGLRQDL